MLAGAIELAIHDWAAAAPVVDIDGTVWIQGGIFLALALLLNPLLFQPWLAAQDRRKLAIGGAIAEAERLRAEAGAITAHYDARLGEARDQSSRVRTDARKSEEARAHATLEAARQASAAELERERDRLKTEAEAARESLSRKVDELAGVIVTKVLGRSA